MGAEARPVASPLALPVVSRKVVGTVEIIKTITVEPHITGNQDELPLEVQRWITEPANTDTTRPNQAVPSTKGASTPVK